MNSSLIGKIEKARRYAQEPDRASFKSLCVDFRGDHSTYLVELKDGDWRCTCSFFASWNTCSHTMAVRKMLGEFVVQGPPETQEQGSVAGMNLAS